MAVRLCPPVARHMLDDREHAAGKAALHDGASERDDNFRISAIGAVADDLMRSLLRHVEHRHGVDGDAEVVQLLGGQSRSSEGSLLRRFGIDLIETPVAARWRHVAPIRRLQTLYSAPLLIDEHEHLVALDRILERGNQRPQLRGRLAIAGEEDEAARARTGKKTPLSVAEL